MANTQETVLPASPTIFSWFFRWAAYCVASIGYVFGLFLVQHTLVSWLLLTGIYGAWLVIYHVGKQRGSLSWLLALFCLACASLFLPLPSANAYWLPILPTMTACMLVATKPRFLGLLASGILWLGTGLALALLARQWDAGSQVILLISFGSTCGCTTTISELAEAHAQLQAYSAQVEELSMIRERNRIAREIHDTLGHSLTLLAVQLETATQHEMRGDPRLHEELLEARQVAKACLTDVRHSVEALRPDDATASSVQEQLRGLVAEFAATCRQTQITLDLEEATHPLHPELGLTLYRCAQEALTNIRKHACATKVLLRLSTTAEQVELTVLDNGQGEPSEHDPGGSGFGLLGMRERVALLHGTLRAGPEAGHGWRVEVLLPLTMQEQAARTQIYTHSTRKKGLVMVEHLRVVIVDDQRLLCEGFRKLIELEPGLEVVGMAGDGEEALALLERLHAERLTPNVVLMDVRMPRLDGIAATRVLKERWPEIHVVILTTFDDRELIQAGLQAGAEGYILKDITAEQLATTIHVVAQGQVLLHPEVAQKVLATLASAQSSPTAAPGSPAVNGSELSPLTEREREILTLLARGASNREISEALYIASGTVKNHLSNILGKLGVRDRTQAALKARELGLL